MPSKTKALILSTSLNLLNQLGESNVASLDIANEMEISPGNLYYHYKGKTEIIDALLKNLEELLQEFTRALKNNSREDNWLSLYVLFEHLHRYQFVFRNPRDLRSAYPESEVTLNKILRQIFVALNDITDSLISDDRESLPVDFLLVFVVNWIELRHLLAPEEGLREVVSEAMIRIEILLSAHVDEQLKRFMTISNHSYRSQ